MQISTAQMPFSSKTSRPGTSLIQPGTSLIQTAKARGLQGVVGVSPSTDKASRMLGQTPKLEADAVTSILLVQKIHQVSCD
jgi:hypothetical protein